MESIVLRWTQLFPDSVDQIGDLDKLDLAEN